MIESATFFIPSGVVLIILAILSVINHSVIPFPTVVVFTLYLVIGVFNLGWGFFLLNRIEESK
jgi:uncharacterized membrane protein